MTKIDHGRSERQLLLRDQYVRRQRAWLRRTKLKPGDLVLVHRMAQSYEDGCGCTWAEAMVIGVVRQVRWVPSDSDDVYEQKSSGIRLCHGDPGSSYDKWYPYFVLEVVGRRKSD